MANQLRKPIHVCHFPPGTSKWNKIEHRMFCHITQNWRGRPSFDVPSERCLGLSDHAVRGIRRFASARAALQHSRADHCWNATHPAARSGALRLVFLIAVKSPACSCSSNASTNAVSCSAGRTRPESVVFSRKRPDARLDRVTSTYSGAGQAD